MQAQDLPEVDFIYYLVSPDALDPDNYEKTYHYGIAHIIELVKERQLNCRIIFASSTRVYHCTDGSWVDEDSPLDIDNQLSQSIIKGRPTHFIRNRLQYC